MPYPPRDMSTARPNRRRLRGCAAAIVAGVVVVALAPLAVALPAETTPPAPNTCPSGLSPAAVTQPPPASTPRTPPKPNPSVTTRADGSNVQTVCVVAPPTPFPAPPVAAGGDRVVLPHRRHGHRAGPRREEPARLAAPGQHPQDPDLPRRHADGA